MVRMVADNNKNDSSTGRSPEIKKACKWSYKHQQLMEQKNDFSQTKLPVYGILRRSNQFLGTDFYVVWFFTQFLYGLTKGA